MPEHDTFDLDAAFSRLEHDVAGISAPRGAGAAIATARRRRRTTIGAVAAVAVLVLAAAAVGQGIAGRDTSIGPAQLPPPAPFDAATLDAATAGWTTGWEIPTKQDHPSTAGLPADCARLLDRSTSANLPSPARDGGPPGLATPDGEVAVSEFYDWGTSHPGVGARLFSSATASMARCSEATNRRDYSWGTAAAVTTWEVPGDRHATLHVWVTRAGNAFAVLLTSGKVGAVPADVDRAVARALVAGLLSSTTYHHTNPSSEASSASANGTVHSVPVIETSAFSHAVAGWQTAWSASSGDRSVSQVPCVTSAVWPGSNGGLESAALGGNGDQEFGTFDTAAHAQAAFEQLRQAMVDCGGSSYKMLQPIRGGGMQTFAASGTEVVWAVQQGRRVGVVTVPGSGTPPPVKVSVAVLIAIQSATRN